MFHAPTDNRLLALAPAEQRACVWGELHATTLGVGDVLVTPNEPIEHVYFPEEGLGSIMAIAAGDRRVEVGLVGRDGMVGTPVLLGSASTPHEIVVQVAGRALRMSSHALRTAVQNSRALEGVLLRYVQALAVQTSYTALVNAKFRMDERLARWILMCHDRLDGDELPTTHHFLSVMVGVNRPGVTQALKALETSGIIRTRRSHVIVQDRARLEKIAGDAYGIPEREYARLLGPMWSGSHDVVGGLRRYRDGFA